MTVMKRVVKPRTRRAKRGLEHRAPKITENTKQCLFFYGTKTSDSVRQCLKNFYSFKKQDGKYLQKKKRYLPFEDILPIEHLSQKYDASLFCTASHTKKRPNNIILGRMYDHHLLDMVELGLENYRALAEFKNEKISAGTKPCMVFCGTQFEDVTEFRKLKNLLIDFFRGVEAQAVRLQGFEHALQFTAIEGKVLFRSYRILLKKSGTRIPRVELEEIGPSLTLSLRRNKFASEDLMKRACRQPKQLKPKKVKNINRDVFGTKLGRVHMTKQDLGKLQTRKMKGLKKETNDKKENSESSNQESSASGPVDVDQ